ncbi:MAG TPA: 4-(cytidine 5'-diphospho)-2-C-methyl-D-erythritol kinase [Verrucomicrobiales bacterium]|nr:4-(cytidine 5'-diphospho)-2-C-methyl-D-erythritol kinase [Verrucomicrobiales bacterium]HRJ10692.1 4-(cytidine 5'-diphospho)-2-C-methyl-D-erythritol kinase [Prosthecobacter sp.]HRK16197.1 4-(cytidine 5'-diphospho)-2-C-methyl-D-erythritol kinase [Prosthecobacter sp.]
MKLKLSSPAKINLWLRILGRRQDGFHEVETRLHKVAVEDVVELELTGPGEDVTLTCTVPGIPLDDSNLAIRALRAFEARAGSRHSWRIHLEKRIPSGAGLGGGSGNAAVILQGANQLLGSPLGIDELLEVAAGIGADVPFFLLETSAADGSGRGEQVAPAPSPGPVPVLLIKPAFPVPTPWAYGRWMGSRELPGVMYAPQPGPWGALQNSLERPVFEKFRLLPALKTWLLERPGVLGALMSGSGSTLFALFESSDACETAAGEAREWVGETAWIRATNLLG